MFQTPERCHVIKRAVRPREVLAVADDKLGLRRYRLCALYRLVGDIEAVGL